MSAAMIEEATPDFEVPVSAGRDKTYDRVSFALNDDTEVLWATRPKQYRLFEIVKALGNLDKVDDFVASAALIEILWEVLDPESKTYLEKRFKDPHDECDLDVVDPTVKSLMGLWYRRPTGKPGASSGSSNTTGSPSTETAPSEE